MVEADGGQHLKPELWKTRPVTEEICNKYKSNYKRHVKDSTTGLWMIPESNPFKVPSITEENFKKGPEVDWWAGGLKKEDDGEWRRQRKEEWADFYSSDNYVKDETTNRMVAAPTEETCKTNNGFVCKVRLDAGDRTSLIMMGMMIAG